MAEYRKLKECLSDAENSGNLFQFRTLVVECIKRMRNERLDKRFVLRDAGSVITKTFRHFHTIHLEYMCVTDTLLAFLPLEPEQGGVGMPCALLWSKRLFRNCKYEWQVFEGCHALFTLFQPGQGSILRNTPVKQKMVDNIATFTSG